MILEKIKQRKSLNLRVFFKDFYFVLLIFIISKFLVLFAWIISRLLSGRFNPPNGERLERGLMAWDGDWYASLVVNGYDNVLLEGVRFFPGYVLLGRFIDLCLPGGPDVALIFLSNISSLFALLFMRYLLLLETGNEELAKKSTWLFAVFPSAFVMTWAYSESLFLSLTISTFIFLRKENWMGAGICAFSAALVRPIGILIAIPAFCAVVVGLREKTKREIFWRVLAVAAAPLGSSVFILWASIHFEKNFIPLEIQKEFRGDFIDPFSRLLIGIGRLFNNQSWTETLHILSAVILIFLIVRLFLEWPLRYGLFTSACFLVSMGSENINSLERYALSGFPIIFALLSLNKFPVLKYVIPLFSAFGLVGLCTLSWLGLYVP